MNLELATRSELENRLIALENVLLAVRGWTLDHSAWRERDRIFAELRRRDDLLARKVTQPLENLHG